MQGGGEERKSSQLVPTLKTQSVSRWLCVLENKRVEGERGREMPAGLLKSVFLLQAAGRQFGGERVEERKRSRR